MKNFIAISLYTVLVSFISYRIGLGKGHEAFWKKIGKADSVIWKAAWGGQDSVATKDVWLYGSLYGDSMPIKNGKMELSNVQVFGFKGGYKIIYPWQMPSVPAGYVPAETDEGDTITYPRFDSTDADGRPTYTDIQWHKPLLIWRNGKWIEGARNN